MASLTFATTASVPLMSKPARRGVGVVHIDNDKRSLTEAEGQCVRFHPYRNPSFS